jgi:hypothetical protein
MPEAFTEKFPTFDTETGGRVYEAVSKGLLPDTTEFYKFIGISSADKGLTPSAELNPFERLFERIYPNKKRQDLSDAQREASKLGMYYYEHVITPLLKAQQELKLGPPTAGMAEAQNPLAFEMAGGMGPLQQQWAGQQRFDQPLSLAGPPGPVPSDITPPRMPLAQQPMPPFQAHAFMQAVPQALQAMGAMAAKQGASEKITNPVDQAIGVMSKGKYRTLQDALDAGDVKVAEAGFEKAKLLIPKEIYAFQQGEQAKRQVEVAGPVAEAGARSRQQVETETKFAGGVQILDSLTKLTPDLFLSEKGGASARAAAAVDIRQRRASGSDPGILQYDQIRNGLRGRLVQLGGDVGNFSQTEQDRAIALIPDPEGGLMSTYPFVKLPDTLEVAKEKLKLLGEFLRIGLEAPKGPSQRSDVQKRLREIVTKVDRLVQTQAGVGGSGKKNITEMTEEELVNIIRGK